MDSVPKLQVKISRLKEYMLEKIDEGDWHGVADAAMDLREKEVELRIALEIQDLGLHDFKERIPGEAVKIDKNL